MTIADILQFQNDYPGEMIPLPSGGWIDPQCAIDVLANSELEPIDIVKQTLP